MDVGERKIGMAVSDALGITAQPLGVLYRKTKKEDLEYIRDRARDLKVAKIVVGLPLDMDGKRGAKAKETCVFAEELNEKIGIPVELWDERLTTMEATRLLLYADVSRKARKRVDDKLAAQLILQSYMESHGT